MPADPPLATEQLRSCPRAVFAVQYLALLTRALVKSGSLKAETVIFILDLMAEAASGTPYAPLPDDYRDRIRGCCDAIRSEIPDPP